MLAVRCIGVLASSCSALALHVPTIHNIGCTGDPRLVWSSRCYGVIRCAPKSTTVLLLLLLLVLWILHYYYKYSYCKCRELTLLLTERELVLYYSQRELVLLLTESATPLTVSAESTSPLTTNRES
mgnify:CR=1 FL=1